MAFSNQQIIAFDALNFLAIFLLAVVLAPPLFSRRVLRRRTWHTLVLSWLVYAIGQILLVGRQTGPLPSGSFCLVQVALNLSTPVFCGVAITCYTLDIYLSIKAMFKSLDLEEPELDNSRFLVLTPWIIFLLVFLETVLVIGLTTTSDHYTRTSPTGLFCRTTNVPTAIVSATVVLLACFCLLFLQVQTGLLLYKNWIRVEKISITSTARKYLHAFIRTLAVTAIAIIGIVLGLIGAFTLNSTFFAYNILTPFLPITAALVFGTYKDILYFYMFWR